MPALEVERRTARVSATRLPTVAALGTQQLSYTLPLPCTTGRRPCPLPVSMVNSQSPSQLPSAARTRPRSRPARCRRC